MDGASGQDLFQKSPDGIAPSPSDNRGEEEENYRGCRAAFLDNGQMRQDRARHDRGA